MKKVISITVPMPDGSTIKAIGGKIKSFVGSVASEVIIATAKGLRHASDSMLRATNPKPTKHPPKVVEAVIVSTTADPKV